MIGERDDGLAPVRGVGGTRDKPGRLQGRDDRAHRLRPHRLGPRQRAPGRGPVALQPQEHGFLGGSQVADVSLLAEAPAERTGHDAQLRGEGGGRGAFGIGWF